MSLESRIVRTLIRWLWVRYPFQMRDIVIGPGRHVQGNPKRKGRANE